MSTDHSTKNSIDLPIGSTSVLPVGSSLYIAGKMRGLPDWNYKAFEEAEERWVSKGYRIFNPAKIGRATGYWPDRTDGNCGKHLRHVIIGDIQTIFICDAIAVLPGWEDSIGATVEVAVAQFLGTPIYCAETMLRLEIPTKPWKLDVSLGKRLQEQLKVKLPTNNFDTKYQVYFPGQEAEPIAKCSYCEVRFDNDNIGTCTLDRSGPIKLCDNCYYQAGNSVR